MLAALCFLARTTQCRPLHQHGMFQQPSAPAAELNVAVTAAATEAAVVVLLPSSSHHIVFAVVGTVIGSHCQHSA
jgi:hypothetical protein